jgi:ribonuclease-3
VFFRSSAKNGTYILKKREFKSRLKKILGFRPGEILIYEAAFIHRSASFTLPHGQKINNERLEFLGDSVLDTILSEFLFKKYPEANEGSMTKIRARIVNRDGLNQLAISMGIDKLLVSNIGNTQPTRHLYGDALEALIGAIFIDKGFRKTRKFIINHILEKYLDLKEIMIKDNDFKSLVFEWVQKKKLPLSFSYHEDYDAYQRKPRFTTTLYIDKTEYGSGQGNSKKEAEQEASAKAWERISSLND